MTTLDRSNPEHAASACLTAYQEIIEAWPDDDPCPDPSDIDLRVAFTLAIAPFYEEWVGHSIPNSVADGATQSSYPVRRKDDSLDATPNSADIVPGSYVLHLHSDGTYSLEKAT